MNYKTQTVSPLIKLTAIILFCLALAAVGVKAQNNRPRPTPTPVEVPEIISRADDFQNNTVIIPPGNPTPTPQVGSFEEKIDQFTRRITELSRRITTLESTKENEYDRKQRLLLLNLDILSRAEQRSQALREQLYNLIEKETEIRLRLERIETDLRPEMIDRVIAFAGTLRPEEMRAARRQSLETEKTNLQGLLTEISGNKLNLQENVQKSDALVEKLRFKLEKEIDEALAGEEGEPK